MVDQEWREPTGRLTLDWKPDLAFTDDTMVYASLARGYKAGGANPPPMAFTTYSEQWDGGLAQQIHASVVHPETFEPEFINAFEIGAKNTLFDGAVTLNLAAFYYDYEGYQISEIVNRSAVNRNFDTEIWGLEIEADWQPFENLRLGFKGGYENTRVADGMRAIDLMDRTAGNPGWVVARPFPTFPSNCILPVSMTQGDGVVDVPWNANGQPGACELAYVGGFDPVTWLPYEPDPTIIRGGFPLSGWPDYPGFDPSTAPNNGEGFFKDLSGNKLPNAPDFTATLTVDYTKPLAGDWLMTLHSDLYYQSEAWWRIFNTEGYDKLKAYTNVNMAAIFTNEAAGWHVMAYVKNVFDRDSITGAFLNSDDTGLTTNVFLTEPRLYGLRVTKEWTGIPLWNSFAERRDPGKPYAFLVEIGGQAQRHDAPNAGFAPSFLAEFPSSLAPRGQQGRDLDWGDGREVRVTYNTAGAWRASLGARFGKTNGNGRFTAIEDAPGGCLYGAAICEMEPGLYSDVFDNYSISEATQREEHTIIDFEVEMDVGLGLLPGASSLGLGLRHARFKSSTNAEISGVPDWDVPAEYTRFVEITHNRYRARADIDREFEGWGPTLSWDHSARLLDFENLGRLDLDWTVTGGVLFGRQETSAAGMESHAYFSVLLTDTDLTRPDTVEQTPLDERRSDDVNVPLVDLSLGLSYRIDRVSIGAGYRWERYFDVLDGGVEERREVDRTVDGPYFKLGFAFGG